MARRNSRNPVSDFMSWLGGARLDVLRDSPGDRARFVAMGGVILSTAFLSAVSAAFALKMAVGAPIAVAILVGVFWGAIILNLDRLLIIGMAKQKGVARNIGLALPRVALALIIGTVISTPLTLQIFSAEINSEIQVMQAEQKAAFEERMASDPRFAAIPDLQASIASNQAIVDQGLQTDLASDPNYAAAVAATASAQAAYDAAQAAYLAEIDGTGGTGIRGDGAVTQSKLTAMQAAEARLTAAQAAQDAAEATATTNLATSAQSRLDAATAQLAADQATLASAQTERASEQAAYDSSVDNSAGLLSRLSALFRLGETNALLNVAHIMIALLFICIELLPVIVKTLSNLGVPTAYDRILELREDGEVSGGAQWAAARADAIGVEAQVQVAVAEDRAARQVKFGKKVNKAVLAQQEAVITRALEVWGSYASERAAARMGEWERDLEESEAASRGLTAADAGAPAGAARSITGSNPLDRASLGRASLDRASLGRASLSDAPTAPFATVDQGATADLTADLAELGFDPSETTPVDPSAAAARPQARVPAKPVSRTADSAALLRRAGLPDEL